ncbi:N-6 DNA methylase [Rhizobium sp. ERR 922]|uniref:type ISP restriction/modification enzyme n=1 Tax=unclassified Rhizobium TaxID=2613769 RepID=UPI0011A57305|nr:MULTISPECIES: type ISP restriction/modification enzyme [unclassified Rhizobium]TWB50056.1 N-6 DNA methylase [Rhizobium sp. ERR 922]TWB92437.1 N-6 DNA methylase [Rhizobium sp. ERR 942]
MELETLEAFAEALTAKFALPGSASPEDQLKPLVADLFKVTGSKYHLTVETRTETHLSDHKVRPDIAIYVGGLICGYVELKAPGLGANAPKLTGEHNKKQWEKLKGLPNLIYTDGREWALYRTGERPVEQPIVKLDGDPTKVGRTAATKGNSEDLGRLFRDFLGWQPIVPHTPSGLARYLAPLSRFLRSEVESALDQSGSAVELLANEWRQFFFPAADNARFADAYAQTVTYAMLLARLSGAAKLEPAEAAKTLDKNNGLLARTLELLGQKAARDELAVGFEMLQRSLEALNPHDFLKSKPDLWLYFYEDFLAAYDPKLRKDYGVYYTPRQVVEFQVRLASELLEKRFGKKLGFADDGVVFLDPAVGTGTYPVAAVKHGLEKVRARSGSGAVPARARQMAENMHGFEVLVGPYAVAHLRLTQALEGAMNDAKAAEDPEEKLAKRLNIYLADTLESPNKAPPGGLDLTHKALTQEHEAARKVKQGGDILVCLGNPPYDRQQIDPDDTTTQRKGGWVRFGDQIKGGAKIDAQGERAIFKDFTDPATKAGSGVHLKNLYNDYVYFWRWALWRLFEKQDCGGIITFITASSFLGGPAFVGMREYMRREFDELYIINLGGDLLGTRKTPNVFNIQTPVAIALGVRAKERNIDSPATVKYLRVEAEDRKGKLDILDGLGDISSLPWEDVSDGWMDPFYPRSDVSYFLWPELTDIFPWQHSGAQFKRVWPIGENKDVLEKRWNEFRHSTAEKRKKLFKETRDRKIQKKYDSFSGSSLGPLVDIASGDPAPSVERYCYRSFDRHYAFIDNRLGDYLRPPLVNARGDKNLFFAALMTKMLGVGAAIVATSDLPDLDVFCGRGGKDVIPLYRDASGSEPNVTGGLLTTIGEVYGTTPSPEDLAAYVYATLGGQSYSRRFWNELETPGPRVPLTKDSATFAEAASLGRKLIWLHTYAERFRGTGRGDEIVPGTSKVIKGVSDNPASYPDAYTYDPVTQEITVGDGRFGPVTAKVWEFEVSGLKVVQSWLGYRMKKRAGKKSSPLDDIRPERWTARMSDELLELLWVLEATLAMEPELENVLDKVVAGTCFTAAELPTPHADERKAPGSVSTAGGLLELMGVDDDIDEGDEEDEDA